ncbi:MAG: excinuclease ABC subunit UvrC [Bacteroidota bacterium]|nr:excinuclease ABC subunit UvrC [Bacteroidota bacterium]MDP4234538.1 excinuclease ABC subunit UvrC [Bacteroidota bacterium]MDP4242603.1 excinuclease ABC subunit UvrC [Bacteroidota bacterium]MDP4289179.1 excinuclease ABC subunit UvrC [Bacteroidota bacterium]
MDDLHSPTNPDEFDQIPFHDDELEQEEDATQIAEDGTHIRLTVTADDFTLDEKLEGLPKEPGVYQFKNGAGRVIYVGKAKVLRSRVRSYFQNYRRGTGDAKLRALVSKIADVELILTDSDVEALILENTLIKKLKPRYNVSLRDDKTYLYVVVTNEPYPRVFATRHKVRDGSKYYGPYTEAGYLRYLLKTLRDIFPIRTCDYYIDEQLILRGKIKVCLEYHIKKCEGPCEGLVSLEQYQGMILKVRQLLSGRTRDVARTMRSDIERLSNEMRFEEAAKVRDQLMVLEDYASKQKVVTEENADRDVFALAHEDDDACGIVFKVRDGKLIGKQHFFFANTEAKSDSEILGALLEQYYSASDYIPEEILLPSELEDEDTLAAWLVRRARELDADSDGAMKPPKLIHPKIGEKAKLMEMVRTNAKYLLGEIKLQKMKDSEHIPHVLKAIERDLHLTKPPRRIECFDNSHLQGTEYVGAMVVFGDGKPKKSDYRKYKIRTITENDDFAAMREVVTRRYGRALEEKSELPDLIIIDGGKGQLSSAYEVMSELGLQSIPMFGLAKRLEELYTMSSHDPLVLPRSSSSLRLLQQVRDEAHRFAITYHRQLREKRTFQTELTNIAGVGKKTAIKLLERFGSVEGVRAASEPELVATVGLKAMKVIVNYFKDQALAEAADIELPQEPEEEVIPQ